ncbi:MAG: hypothetical protein AAB875_00680, partial [Patescibacteria group bacterium]
VALFADEASAVPDEIYRATEGSLTSKDFLFIMIGNPTRLEGFFYDTHHDDKKNWQTFQFSSLDSSLVEPGFDERIKAKYGASSDEYAVDVLGQFPRAEGMIDGWMPMFSEEDIKNQIPDIGNFVKPTYMGVDPSGMGKNYSVWVGRDAFRCKVLATEAKSTDVSIAEKTITLSTHYEIKPENVKLDNFGVGANVSAEIALGVHERIHAVNVGAPPREERFLNIRAEMYWCFREWLKKGGQLVRNPAWRQLLNIRYKRTLGGKIQVMSKEDMVRKGWDSPDEADAAALSFVYSNVGHEAIALGSIYNYQRELSNEEIAKAVNIYG